MSIKKVIKSTNLSDLKKESFSHVPLSDYEQRMLDDMNKKDAPTLLQYIVIVGSVIALVLLNAIL